MKKSLATLLAIGSLFGATVPTFATYAPVEITVSSSDASSIATATVKTGIESFYLKAIIHGFSYYDQELIDSAEKTLYFTNSVTTPTISVPNNEIRYFVVESFVKTSSTSDMQYDRMKSGLYY
ncbi:hypothetical protein AN641_10165 [Candidatus Epulonipiscioides gigas]|nr:hypothetical protein AN641_10165 [Epulopiscium sp. SCG-C07WGA-EpuloA2]